MSRFPSPPAADAHERSARRAATSASAVAAAGDPDDRVGAAVSGAEPPRGFAVAEFERRLARLQSAMARDGHDGLLLTTEADIRYVSGFLTAFWQSPTRPWFLLVPVAGEPVAVIPSIGADCMGRTWVRDIRTWRSPCPADDGVSLLAEALRERVGASVRVGIPAGPGRYLRMPLADFERLKAALPGCTWSDATATVDGVRAVKSDAEVGKIRHVCEAASRAFAALPAFVAPGQSDIAVFRAFRKRCLDEGVDEVPYLVGAAGAGGYGDIISPPSGRALANGDVLILDTGCTFDGYFCDFDRNYAVGTPGAAAESAHAVAWEATEAGLAAARPGALCRDVFEAMRRVMAPHAIASGGDVGRLGHGLGTELTEPPSLMSDDTTELRAGMVMTLEPGYAFAEGRMMVHEENVLITADGCELLSVRAPERLRRIG